MTALPRTPAPAPAAAALAEGWFDRLMDRLLDLLVPPHEPLDEAERRDWLRDAMDRNPLAFRNESDLHLWMSHFPTRF